MIAPLPHLHLIIHMEFPYLILVMKEDDQNQNLRELNITYITNQFTFI